MGCECPCAAGGAPRSRWAGKTHASKVGVRKLGPLCTLRIAPDLHLDDLKRGTRAGLEKDVKNVVLEGLWIVNEQPRYAAAPRECADALKGSARGGEIQGDCGSGSGSGDEEKEFWGHLKERRAPARVAARCAAVWDPSAPAVTDRPGPRPGRCGGPAAARKEPGRLLRLGRPGSTGRGGSRRGA